MTVLASVVLALQSEGPAAWVHLLPAGTFRGADGRGPWRLPAPRAVIAASLPPGAKLPVDENHSTDRAAPQGRPSPARGWVTALEARADGIWGRVEWTNAGRALLAERAYGSLSPVFTHAPDGTVLKLLRVALTNTPNLAELTALASAEAPAGHTRSAGVPLDPAEAEMCRRMALDPADFLQSKLSLAKAKS